MSKIQDVPFITKVIDTLSDELKSGLYDLIDGQVKTPVFRSLVNNDYAITEANDKGKVQFVTLETLRGNYTGYLAYNSVYCVLIAFKGNTQALDMLNINVAKHTFAFVNESLSILELRVELEDGKEGVTPTDLGVTNNNIHLAKGTTQIGEGVNLKTLDGNTLIGSGNVGFKTINDQEIVGDGNIVVGEGGTIAIDTAFDETSTNAVQNKVIAKFANEVVDNKANVDGNYPTMTVGDADNANNLIATKGLEVESYFTFEKTGGEQASAIETGNATLKNLYGNTKACSNLSHVATLSVGVVTPIGTTLKSGEVYSFTFKGTLASGHDSMTIALVDDNSHQTVVWMNTSGNRITKTMTLEKDYSNIILWGASGDSVENLMIVKGNTALDYEEYYDGLKHTHITGLKTTGINLWDEEWELGLYDSSTGAKFSNNSYVRSTNAIKVSPNEVIYLKSPYQLAVFQYDVDGVYLGTRQFAYDTTITIPSDCHYIRFFVNSTSYGTTYNHDICINFSNPNINGNYYPYEQDTFDIDFEGNEWDYLNIEEKKKYEGSAYIASMADLNWQYTTQGIPRFFANVDNLFAGAEGTLSTLICSEYEAVNVGYSSVLTRDGVINIHPSAGVIQLRDDSCQDVASLKAKLAGKPLVYKLATPIVTDVSIPNDTIKVWNGGSMEALGTEIPVGTKIFYQKNIKAFVEAFGEAIDWNPERIERLAKLSITPEYVNISLNPSQANAYAVAQVYNATFTIVISTALTGTPNGEITFQDSEIDLSSFETQPAESIYDMDGKKVSEEPTTTDCNIASFVGRSYNGIVLWSLLHSGVNKVKVHFEQAIPLDSEGNGKLDCRASLIL